MSIDFKHRVRIDRPASDVFAFVADFANNPSWQGGMLACEWTSETTLSVGSTYFQHAQFLGRRIDTHFRVVEFVPGKSISIESTQSTFPIQVTRSVDADPRGGCWVTAHIRGQPTGLLKLMSGMVKRSVARDYDELKRQLEAPP